MCTSEGKISSPLKNQEATLRAVLQHYFKSLRKEAERSRGSPAINWRKESGHLLDFGSYRVVQQVDSPSPTTYEETSGCKGVYTQDSKRVIVAEWRGACTIHQLKRFGGISS